MEDNGSSKKLVEIVARAVCCHSGKCAADDGEFRCQAHKFMADGQAVLTAIKEAGMVIVPREPTEAHYAKMMGRSLHSDDRLPFAWWSDKYRAMITAGEE